MEELEDRNLICADTDVLIDFLKKKEPGSRAYEHWRRKGKVAITSITAFELLFGARRSNLRQKRYEEAKSLVEQQHSVLPLDQPAADKASEIGAELEQLGQGLEIRDLFNAAICANRNIPLLTRNKGHYQRVTGLKLIDA